ncbi:unnamed protein product [Didymodactylos carnosus]|uniref:Protein AF-10 n=1 Tax=Didymodactylos carnosus TaxID=1234261 RepID=A0A813Q5F1_9BILA|nr:unnamed protein product [Didymodactylos carnosus]CAF0851811.1 unnamed protein product [Didymodactylos carnosus]CAF3543390.1 unnamed protein product [Didymodactylos carnosus]CAF3637004.1 unnamed protein product [Didymodactylos carnosus]
MSSGPTTVGVCTKVLEFHPFLSSSACETTNESCGVLSSDQEHLVGGCCVCSDDQGWAENPLVYCDGKFDEKFCTVAVHQACYGIVSVPEDSWFCGRCELKDFRASCQLCPSKQGAMKKTNTGGWAHVVCALYIPEVEFENVETMEPIILTKMPVERYKLTCYICEKNGTLKESIGACMTCSSKGCKTSFHVSCAQTAGLLCEVHGQKPRDNVKYCGYCELHLPTMIKSKTIRQIPPFKHDQSSPENGRYNKQFSTSICANKKKLFTKTTKNNSIHLLSAAPSLTPKDSEESENVYKEQTLFAAQSPTSLILPTAPSLADFVAASRKDSDTTCATESTYDCSVYNSDQSTCRGNHDDHSNRIRKASTSSSSSCSPADQSTKSPNYKRRPHSSSSSSSTSSKKKKNSQVRSLTDLSQFVQLTKQERNSQFLSPQPPPPLSSKKIDDDLDSSDRSGELLINEDVLDKDSENMVEQQSKKLNENLTVQEKELNEKEEKPLAVRRMDNTKKIDVQKHRQLNDGTTPVTRITAASKKYSGASLPQVKVEMIEEEDMQKRRKNSRCCSKEDNSKMQQQPRQKRQLSISSDITKNNRKSKRKYSTISVNKQQQHPPLLNGDVLRRGSKEKRTKLNMNNHHNMKHQKINNNVITMNDNKTMENYHDPNRSSIYYQCDHFGNHINADSITENEQREHSEHSPPFTDSILGLNKNFHCSSSTETSNGPIMTNKKQISPNHPVPKFFPKRPLHDFVLPTATSHINTQKPSQSSNSSFIPQSLEEFLEHEWEMSSDFVLQQTIPYDVSSLLSCLYQFRSENASLNQKVDELKARRDLLRLRHSNLKRRLVEIFNPPQAQEAGDKVPIVSTTTEPIISLKRPKLEFVSPKEQDKRLNSDHALQQQILQQTIVPTVSSTPPRHTSQNTSNIVDLSRSTPQVSRHSQNHSPCAPTSYTTMRKPSQQTHSILENQLRQNVMLNNKKSAKAHHTSDQQHKINAAAASLLQLNKVMNKHQSPARSSSSSVIAPPTADNTSLTPSRERRISSSSLTVTSSTHQRHPPHINGNHSSSSSSSPYEQDVYLSKNSSHTSGTNLDYLQAILAAGGDGGIPPNFLLAPTWNIHNFGFANFSNSSMMDDTVLRSLFPNPSLNALENVQQPPPSHHQKQ